MLSSFRKAPGATHPCGGSSVTARRQAVHRQAVRLLPLALAGSLPYTGPAMAAQIYYQPNFSLSTNYNSNIDLSQTNRNSAEGYFADASTLVGIATPRSETTLMPRLLYNYYPTESGFNRLEGFMNLNSRYSWRTTRLNLTGFYDHRIDLNAETPSAEFNPVNPGIGNAPETTGQIAKDVTRDYLILDPTITHNLTPLSSIGVGAEYQRLSFSTTDSGHIGFNYYLARAFFSHTFTPRLDGSMNVFAAHYIATGIDSHSNAGGAALNMGYNWSPVLRSTASVTFQRTKLIETSPGDIDQTSNTYGATFETVYSQAASSYRLAIGRSIAPSGSGGLYVTNQARAAYERDITQRLNASAAVRVFRTRTVSGASGDDTRDYATATLRAQWMVTRTIYVAGSYTYVWQKYRVDPLGAADTNVANFQIGYRGLQRQR